MTKYLLISYRKPGKKTHPTKRTKKLPSKDRNR